MPGQPFWYAIGTCMQCSHCAYPNPYWSRRCDRCGASVHSKMLIFGLPLAVTGVLLAGLLLLSGP
jgi:hypothetical protein